MSILILGGTSDIGGEIARLVAAGEDVVLAARRVNALEGLTAELQALGATSVHPLEFEATDLTSHRAVVQRARELTGSDISLAVVAFGILGDQQRA